MGTLGGVLFVGKAGGNLQFENVQETPPRVEKAGGEPGLYQDFKGRVRNNEASLLQRNMFSSEVLASFPYASDS